MKDQLRFALFRRRALRRAGAIIESGAYCDAHTTLIGENRVCSGSKLIATKLGYGSYVGEHCSLVRTVVGNYSCVGPRVESVLGAHPASEFASIHPAFFSTRAQAGFTYVSENRFPEFGHRSFGEDGYLISVGSDVWIGHGARIMQGVRVEDGAVVAAGSIVTKDVDPFTIVAGFPAKPLRTRFSAEIIRRLQQAAWWNRTPEELQRLAPAFSNVERLLDALETNSPQP